MAEQDLSRPYVGYRSAGRRPESQQDRTASANAPLSALRGYIAGTLGLPGDIEGLGRMLIPGVSEQSYLPDSEYFRKVLPMRELEQTPIGRAFTEAGGLAGGAGLMTAGKVVGKGGKAGARYAGEQLNRAILDSSGPLARLVPEAAKPMYVVKPKGGNWLAGGVEAALDPMRRYVPSEETLLRTEAVTPVAAAEARARSIPDAALNNWLDTKLNKYIKNEMGTPEDPVRALAERGILHVDPAQLNYRLDAYGKYPQPGQKFLAQSDAAKIWEGASDNALANAPARQWLERADDRAYAKVLEENPWLSKVPPETPVNQVSESGTLANDLGFDHIMDVLREDLTTGRIRPDQLSKINMEQAVRRTAEYDQELAAKINSATAAAREGLPVYKEYPEGYRWIELNRPGSFAAESDSMGHSVRGYEPPKGHPDWVEGSGDAGSSGYGHGGWEAIKRGDAKVYSLVDSKGAPHTTVEISKKKELPRWNQIPDDIAEQLKAEGTRLGNEQSDASRYSLYGDERDIQVRTAIARLKDDWAYNNPIVTQSISQIKGKGNAAPNKEYLPFVQDFVRGDSWSNVGDLRNTGLRDIQKTPVLAKYLKDKGVDAPRYLPETDYLKYEDDYLMERLYPKDTPPAQGMAHGGPVSLDQLAAHYDKGGAVKAGIKKIISLFDDGEEALTAAQRAEAGRKAAELIKAQEQVKASEALGQLMERGTKRTTTTQSDRTRVGGGNIGGAAFPAISQADPAYAGKVWGVMDEGTAARLKNLTSPDTAWTTMLGAANQLKSNPIVFDKLKRGFLDSMKKGNLSDDLAGRINQNLALTFGEGADIRNPKIWREADTFKKRAALADVMMGQGIAPGKGGVALGGEKSGKGVIFKPTDILKRETEPSLLHSEYGGGVPTSAAGPRLFKIGKESEYRPDLHPGFPTLLRGEDLGINMIPTPTEVYLPDWHARFKKANPDRAPGYYDLSLGVKGEGLPSQEINDAYIRHLMREGYAEGGSVNSPATYDPSLIDEIVSSIDEPTGYAEGGSVRMAQGGSVSAYDADLVDAIANQFM